MDSRTKNSDPTPPAKSPTLWVQKFGGTSVATPELLENAARRIAARREQGYSILAVVSAMGDTTDRLLALAHALSPTPPRRELDVLLSAGEVQAMALLAMALCARGIPAISFTGAQGGILTDDRFSEARIRRIDGDRIAGELASGKVVVVAGFQGVTDGEEITTLGRGGSDTSAVALAAALGACHCEILTDVSGVFTANPRIVPAARRIERLSYDEMLEMATYGARVLHGRAVDLARRYHVPLTVASSLEEAPGTSIEGMTKESPMDMESVVVRAIAEDPDVCKVSVVKVPDRPGVAARIFSVLGKAGVQVRLIVQAQSHAGHNDITFIVPGKAALDRDLLARAVAAVGGESTIVDEEVGLLSVVGEGITRDPQIAAKVFTLLAEAEINIDAISSSNLVLTCVVPQKDLARGARVLHAGLLESG